MEMGGQKIESDHILVLFKNSVVKTSLRPLTFYSKGENGMSDCRVGENFVSAMRELVCGRLIKLCLAYRV